jgi:hypothetical protein
LTWPLSAGTMARRTLYERYLWGRAACDYDPEMPPISSFPYPKQRRFRRFDLQFPVCVSFPAGEAVRTLQAVSENVSIGGLLLKTAAQVPPHTRVNLSMEVSGPRARRSVRLMGEGEVIRVQELGPGAGFAVAVQCDKPITEIGRHLSAAS